MVKAAERPMASGRRDRVVRLEALQSMEPGSSRFPVETWDALDDVFASKENISGRERFMADQFSASADTRWEIPYRADMDPDVIDVPKTRRLVYEGRVYRIQSAQHIGRREGIALDTLAKVG